MLITVSLLIILGGLGFSVILETIRCREGFRSLSLHTRIVLTLTGILLAAGTLVFLFAEGTNATTLNAFFQSFTLRTAGFNSFDLSRMRDGSKLFSTLLMFIGASPASTGGGVKTTTTAVLFYLMLNVIRGEKNRPGMDPVPFFMAIIACYSNCAAYSRW